MLNKTKFDKKKGFTLVELIIVVAIIAVLASISFMALSGETSEARDSRRLSDLKTIEDSVSTSNAKNRTIDYDTSDSITTSTTQGIITNISTVASAGAIIADDKVVRVLRNAKALEIGNTLVDATILSNVARDPKGMPYVGAFLTDNLYQIIGVKENAETRIPTAIIKGSFKEGAVVDNLINDITNVATSITIGNADQFIAGDVIIVDSEKMAISGVDISTETITVMRGYNSTTAKIHNKKAPIKLATFSPDADGLLCFGKLKALTGGTGTPIDMNDDGDTSDSGIDISTLTGDTTYICDEPTTQGSIYEGAIIDDGRTIPYDVNTQN